MKPGFRLILAALAVAVLQIGFLGWMIAGRAAILRDGREILLRAEPIDPRDLLRGDYVILGYPISSIPVASIAGLEPNVGQEASVPIFVRVKPGADGFATFVAARAGGPVDAQPAPDEVDLRGTAASAFGAGADTVRVLYGLERYYVPEGEGRAIETGVAERSISVRAAVGQDGTAQIKALLDGGEMLYEEPLY